MLDSLDVIDISASNNDYFVCDIDAAASTDTQPIQKFLYDRKSAAFALSISTRTLDYVTANGLIDHVKQGSKKMYLPSALQKFARTNHASLTESE